MVVRGEAVGGAAWVGDAWVGLDVQRAAGGGRVARRAADCEGGRLGRGRPADEVPDYVPNLAEAVEACGGMGVNVEVKNLPGDPDHDVSDQVCAAVAGLVAAYRPTDELLVSSFDISAVDRIRGTDPTLPTGWLVVERHGTDLVLDRVVAHGHGFVNPWDELVDESMVVAAHQRGLRMVVWTVDDPGRISQLADWGVDGIITNRPEVARRVIDGRFDGTWVDG